MDYKEAAEYCVKNLMPNLSVFIGAGLSIDAKLPSWNELVEPLAKELDIPMVGIPLERVLEYICGESTSKYSMLIYSLKRSIQKAKPAEVHYLISKLGVGRIWTTNYDDLIEKAFQEGNYDLEVVTNDQQLNNVDLSKPQLIKMHGSLSKISDNYDDIVLLESQYENYEESRKDIYNLLKNDISNKSFLFFGVSFNDINMRRIWASIWNYKKAGHPSFLFTVPPKQEDEDRYKIYWYWKKGLSRYGIEVIELNSYKEISEFLNRIYISKQGKTIAGLGIYKDDTHKELCRRIGALLAERGYNYNSGGGMNISNFIAEGMWNKCPEIKEDLDRIVFFYRENGGSTNPQKGKIIYAGATYTDMRKRFISPEKLCLLLGDDGEGRDGLKEEVGIAREKKCSILAVPTTGEISMRTYKEEAENWKNCLEKSIYKKYEQLEQLGNDPVQCANNIVDIMDYYFNYTIKN